MAAGLYVLTADRGAARRGLRVVNVDDRDKSDQAPGDDKEPDGHLDIRYFG